MTELLSEAQQEKAVRSVLRGRYCASRVLRGRPSLRYNPRNMDHVDKLNSKPPACATWPRPV
jgi:hypothetical protein